MRLKRFFDLLFVTPGLLLLLPFFILIALWIKLDSSGPVFFRQERIGRDGVPFRIWKFRTMVVDADRHGAQITVGSDSRITRAGKWLRASKVDELPQLINVLLGEMSLVGPRPEVARYVDMYTEEQRAVLQLIPGITDLASINYANESEILGQQEDPERYYINVVVPDKIRINLEYAMRANIFSDFLVILQTLGLFRSGRS